MRSQNISLFKPRILALGLVAILLLALVACGAAATATPPPKATPAPAAKATPVPAVPAAAATPAPKSVPTAAPTPAPAAPKAISVKRLIFASAGFVENNRFWVISRPQHLQFDPFLETLLDLDPKTGEFTPRLADKWESSPDAKEWTFFLRKGVQFHSGFGEFTARDVAHAHSLFLRADATATFTGFWKAAEELKVVSDYQVVFRMKGPSATMPYSASRSGDLRAVSKAQWDKEALEGFDKKPAGTGSYRYLDRKLGQFISYESVENHWRGEKPDFKELEIRLAPEDATRLALLLSGEAHIVDLPRDLHKEALNRGMKILSSQLPVDWMTVYFGGQYHIPGDPKFQADVPWNDKRVRQALNMAVNRKELLDAIFAGKGTLTYVSGFLPISEGWNPDWERRFNELYGYNPTKAKALLEAAGYRPGSLKVKIVPFVEPGESEGPAVAEALALYFKQVGIQTEIEQLDVGKHRELNRTKQLQCCIWPNIISWRPSEEWIRTSNYSKGSVHHFQNEFIEKTYLELIKTVNPKERDRLARAIGDNLFEEFADMPLFWFANEVLVNPKVVAEWTYPGAGAGRTTHFDLLKAAR